jgi:hypothetical protein
LSPLAATQLSALQVESPMHMLFLQVHPALGQVVPHASEPPHLSPMVPQ